MYFALSVLKYKPQSGPLFFFSLFLAKTGFSGLFVVGFHSLLWSGEIQHGDSPA